MLNCTLAGKKNNNNNKVKESHKLCTKTEERRKFITINGRW